MPIENELKMNVCLLTICLNHFNEYKLRSGWALRKRFFPYGIVKSISELRHTFFVNLRLRPVLNLGPPALFYKIILRSAATSTQPLINFPYLSFTCTLDPLIDINICTIHFHIHSAKKIYHIYQKLTCQ